MGSTSPSEPQPMTATCSKCGCESPLVEYFSNTFSGKVCPGCMPTASNHTMLYVIFFVLAMALLLLLGPAAVADLRPWRLLVNLALYVVLTWLTMAAHEAIHATAAWLLGGRVFEVSLGAGRRLTGLRWHGTRFSVRRGIFLGYCAAAFRQRSWIRTRWFVFIAAPLTAQIVLVLLLLPAFNLRAYLTQVAVLESVVVVNILLIATNLFPRRLNALVATDGQLLLDLVTGRKTAEELHITYFLAACAYASEDDDAAAMAAACESGLALYPAHRRLKTNLATAYVFQDRDAEALVLFDELLADETPAPSAVRGICQCNRAVALFHLALEPGGISDEQLAEAHAAAGEAFWLLPWLSPVRIEHAVSAHYDGRHDEALALLEKELTVQDTDARRANVLALIALVEHALGQGEAAQATIGEARRIYPKGSHTIERIDEIVGLAG
ncbi:MAG: tetratricopeptide repeat protein [Anaerolineales bacterium]|nr:tetratricopeptide repeat protein [Anaerolineales bacterium]